MTNGTPGWRRFRIPTVLALTLAALALASFAGPNPDQFLPWINVEGRDGNFYGAMRYGNEDELGGLVYSLDLSGQYRRIQKFRRFRYSPKPSRAIAVPSVFLAVAQDGSIYGSTDEGGIFAGGALFKMDPKGQYSILHQFEWAGSKGPILAAQNGDVFVVLHGATTAILRLAKDGSHDMIPINGWAAGIAETSNHEIIVGTSGYSNDGNLWRLDSGNQFELLADVGYYPHNLIPLQDGSILCLTDQRLVQVSSTGEITVIHEFNIPFEGTFPNYLGIAKDGSYVGSTAQGGIERCGTVFRIVPGSNSFTVLSHLPAPGVSGAGVKWMQKVFPIHAAANSGNRPPMAKDDIIEAADLRSVEGALPKTKISVLINDTDADLNLLSIVSVGAAQHGEVEFDFIAQSITYTANSPGVQNDSFTYTIVDGGGGSSTARVVIRTNPAGRYTGLISSPPDPNTGDPGTVSGELSVKVDSSRNAVCRLKLLNKTYRFGGHFNGVNQFGTLLSYNPDSGKTAAIQLWLRPSGVGWIVEANIRNNYLPFEGSCTRSK
jgi:Bacterial Ig domain